MELKSVILSRTIRHLSGRKKLLNCQTYQRTVSVLNPLLDELAEFASNSPLKQVICKNWLHVIGLR